MVHPTLRQLDIFAAVIRSGDIAASARELGLDPAEVAADVRDLEARLGHRLLETGEQGDLVLTGAGRHMVEALRLLEQSLKQDADGDDDGAPPRAPAAPPRAVAVSREEPALRLVFATHPSLFVHFRDALAEFEADNPQAAIDLDLDCFTAASVKTRMAKGVVDIAYFYTVEDQDAEDGPPSDYVWTERLSLFVGDANPLARIEMARTADLALEPALLLGRANPLRPLIDALLDRAGFGGAQALIECNDYARLLDILRDGQGFLPLFGGLAQQAATMEGIRRLPFADPLPAPQVRRALSPHLVDNPLARDLVNRLS